MRLGANNSNREILVASDLDAVRAIVGKHVYAGIARVPEVRHLLVHDSVARIRD